MADSKLSALTEVSVPALSDYLYQIDGTPTSNKVSRSRDKGILNHVAGGRLTLTSGTPVTTSDVTGATSVYYTPFTGQCVALYDGTRWRMYVFTELTLALGTITSGLPYDVFLYDNAGTLTLELLAWTNGTTRATALVQQDGVYCKTGALTRRYVGTFYTTATTTTEDSDAKRFLWNMYNQVPRRLVKSDATSHTYATASWRYWNNDSSMKAQFVIGQAQSIRYAQGVAVDSGTYTIFGVGEDTAAANSQTPEMRIGAAGFGYFGTSHIFQAAVGYHYLSALEYAVSGTSSLANMAVNAVILG